MHSPPYKRRMVSLWTQPNVLVTEVFASDNHVQEDQRQNPQMFLFVTVEQDPKEIRPIKSYMNLA